MSVASLSTQSDLTASRSRTAGETWFAVRRAQNVSSSFRVTMLAGDAVHFDVSGGVNPVPHAGVSVVLGYVM